MAQRKPKPGKSRYRRSDEELIADSGPLEVLDPDAFGWYAITFTAVLIVSHWLLGYVWPRRWQPSRITNRVVLVLTLAVVAAAHRG